MVVLPVIVLTLVISCPFVQAITTFNVTLNLDSERAFLTSARLDLYIRSAFQQIAEASLDGNKNPFATGQSLSALAETGYSSGYINSIFLQLKDKKLGNDTIGIKEIFITDIKQHGARHVCRWTNGNTLWLTDRASLSCPQG